MIGGMSKPRLLKRLVILVGICVVILVLIFTIDLAFKPNGSSRKTSFSFINRSSRFCGGPSPEDEAFSSYNGFISSIGTTIQEYLRFPSQWSQAWEGTKSEVPLPNRIPDGGIYFLETSGLPFLSPKQLCAIESAALHNPKRTVVTAVLSKHLLASFTVLQLLNKYMNIRLVHLNATAWLNGTVLEHWLEQGLLEKSQFRTAHTSDILRCVTLFKHGGIYLDLDNIVIQPLESLRNAVGLQEYTVSGTANGVMAFDKEHPVMANYLLEINRTYDKDGWGNNGPTLIAKVLRSYCSIVPGQTMRPSKCKDVELVRTEAFYPVPYGSWTTLFDGSSDVSSRILQSFNQSLMVHYWNKLSFGADIYPLSQQSLGVLAREHCPVISREHPTGLWGLHK